MNGQHKTRIAADHVNPWALTAGVVGSLMIQFATDFESHVDGFGELWSIATFFWLLKSLGAAIPLVATAFIRKG